MQADNFIRLFTILYLWLRFVLLLSWWFQRH